MDFNGYSIPQLMALRQQLMSQLAPAGMQAQGPLQRPTIRPIMAPAQPAPGGRPMVPPGDGRGMGQSIASRVAALGPRGQQTVGEARTAGPREFIPRIGGALTGRY